MAINILRITRHKPSNVQRTALRSIYGNDANIITVNRTINSASDVVRLIRKHRASVVEVVLPLHLLEQVVQEVNIPVIRAVTLRHGAHDLIFSHYEQIHSITTETTILGNNERSEYLGKADYAPPLPEALQQGPQ